MSRRAPRSLAAALVLLPLAGCASAETTDSDRPFSSREAWREAQAGPDAVALSVSRVDVATAEAMRAQALDLLRQASNARDPLLRANAAEAARLAPDVLEPDLRVALADGNRGVRFVAAMTVGHLERRGLVSHVRPLLSDPSDSVRAAAIFAMRRCGEPVDLTPLAGFALSNDLEVKGNAVLVLGELGDDSAGPLLRDALEIRSMRASRNAQRRVELQVAEALVKIGEEPAIQAVRAALFSREGEEEIRALACQILGVLGDEAYLATLQQIVARTRPAPEPVEVRLAAATSVARIRGGEVPADLVIGYLASTRAEHRAQAAYALGWIRGAEALDALGRALRDPSPMVQVSAAASILRATG